MPPSDELELPRRDLDPDIEPGLGTPCPESQADGVPCEEPAADCRECPRAI